MEGLSLIDVSSEDDVLLSSSCEGLPDPSLLDPPNINRENHLNADPINKQEQQEEDPREKLSDNNFQFLEINESPEHKRPKSSNFNMRKSLAWDSAFFTSEGVLNTEELATIHGSITKTEKLSLPGIPEELRRSAESSSTLDSDSWALDSLETELFENVRASIQKSLGKSGDKEGNVDRTGVNVPRVSVKEKGLRASQNKTKLPTRASRVGLPPKQSENKSKATPITANSAACSKPPRILPKTTVPKTLNKSTVPKTLNKSTVPPAINPKRSSTGTALNRRTACTPVSRSVAGPPNPNPKSINPSTSKSSKSLVPTNNKKKPTISRNPAQVQPNNTKTLILNATKSKPNPIQLTKLPTTASPTSSFESVKSCSTIDSSTSASSHQSPVLLLGCNLQKDPVKSNNNINNNSSQEKRGLNSRPSGLRMPTPKMSYFDAEKSVGQNGQSSLPRNNSKTQLQNVVQSQTVSLSGTEREKPIETISKEGDSDICLEREGSSGKENIPANRTENLELLGEVSSLSL